VARSWVEPEYRERGSSRPALLATVDVAVRIDADVVLHVGSHGDKELAPSLGRIGDPIGAALERATGTTHILLENCAGGGGTIGRSVDELATIVDRLHRDSRLGLCPEHLPSPGRDGKGPDALEMRRLRRLCTEASIPIGDRTRRGRGRRR
jgi:deoxyribonuclease-4